MRQKSSIILVIVSTTTDLIYYTVLEEARANDVDLNFRRTFGIVTLSDRLERGGTLEQKHVEVIKSISIDPQRRFNGIESLGKKLSRMFFDHITQDLPRVINRIEHALSIPRDHTHLSLCRLCCT